MSTTKETEPIDKSQLQSSAREAIDEALKSATQYEHSRTPEWNTSIIDGLIRRLIEMAKNYKFAVHSIILQRAVPNDTGNRGMHAASGAYWNNEKDGMWSHKYEAAEKGIDVVVSVLWIAV